MLSNAECWIDLTKTDLEKLEIPDKISARHVLGAHGNPSKAFTYLKLGFLPTYILSYMNLLDLYEPNWINLNMLGPVLTYIDTFGPIWTPVDTFEPILT